MRIILILLILALHTASCRTAGNYYKESINQVLNYCEKIKAEQGIICSGEGLRCDLDKNGDGKVRVIVLGFDTNKKMKYKEARTFFYEMVDGLLAHLNKNEKIRSYFFHSPITYADLELHLTFDFSNSHLLKKGEVASIYLSENKITYNIVEKEAPNKAEDSQNLSGYFAEFFKNHRSITHKLPEDADMDLEKLSITPP